MTRSCSLALIFGLAFSFGGCAKEHTRESTPPDTAPPVRVNAVRVQSRAIANGVEVTGTVRPVQRATVAARVMGTIARLPVALGASVRRGDLLVEIAALEVSARVAQAQVQLNQARRDLSRERTLLEQNASTSDLVKSLEDRVALNEAMLHEAEAMLGYTRITAPFDGVVARKPVDAGDLAAPGMALLELEGFDRFEVEAGIPDSLAARVAVGAELSVVVPGANASFEGRVAELAPAADPKARTVAVRIAVPPEVGVRSGQFARIEVPGAPVSALFVPSGAVTSFGQLDRIFIAAEQRAVLRLVEVGGRRGMDVEILSGVASGDVVVVDPPAGLREGQRVEVQP